MFSDILSKLLLCGSHRNTRAFLPHQQSYSAGSWADFKPVFAKDCWYLQLRSAGGCRLNYKVSSLQLQNTKNYDCTCIKTAKGESLGVVSFAFSVILLL